MATVFALLTNSSGAPLTGAAPTFDYWDKATPGAPAATGVAMTELLGGAGGIYFADIATADGVEYAAIVDGTASAAPRYQIVSFSGETDERIQVDVPAILADTNDIQTRLPAALVGGRIDADVGNMQTDTVDANALAADAVAEIADGVWDEPLAGHTTGGTTGRAELLNAYASKAGNVAVHFDSNIVNVGTVLGVDGTVDNPVSTETAARAIADALGIRTYFITTTSSLTLTVGHDRWLFLGDGFVDPGGQSLDNARFVNVSIGGALNGTSIIFVDGANVTITAGAQGLFRNVLFTGTTVVQPGFVGILADGCTSFGTGGTAGFDLSGVGDCTVSMTNFAGRITISGMNSAGDNATVTGQYAATLTGNTAGGIQLRGIFSLSDSASGATVDTTTRVGEVADDYLGGAGVHGAGLWTGAAGGLTPTQATQLEEAWQTLGLDLANPVQHRDAIVGTPGWIRIPVAGTTINIEVDKIDATTVELTRQP